MNEPKLIDMDAMLIAGISGNGDETGLVWENYMKLEKMQPLSRTVDKKGYEVRMYPGGTGPGHVHIGMRVPDRDIPEEYRILELPASSYVAFEIYPAMGYESSNRDIEQWLYDNSGIWVQREIDKKTYGVEVYDERFKGGVEPDSVVGMLVPVKKV